MVESPPLLAKQTLEERHSVMKGNGLGPRLRGELEPLLVHGAVALTLEAMVLVIGAGVKLLALLFPEKTDYVALIATIDVWFALAVLCLFGTYTLVEVLLRLSGAVVREYRRQFSPSGGLDDQLD